MKFALVSSVPPSKQFQTPPPPPPHDSEAWEFVEEVGSEIGLFFALLSFAVWLCAISPVFFYFFAILNNPWRYLRMRVRLGFRHPRACTNHYVDKEKDIFPRIYLFAKAGCAGKDFLRLLAFYCAFYCGVRVLFLLRKGGNCMWHRVAFLLFRLLRGRKRL